MADPRMAETGRGDLLWAAAEKAVAVAEMVEAAGMAVVAGRRRQVDRVMAAEMAKRVVLPHPRSSQEVAAEGADRILLNWAWKLNPGAR